ncbi:MAG TPA: LysM peptidoglycan-binding domain-containing protein [Jatrophihabitans sp.]|nr:LysM peptidoglycan-binding domain-containing protein [Jatrophihabitans sp.]
MSAATELAQPVPVPLPASRARLAAVPATDEPRRRRAPVRPERRNPGPRRPQVPAERAAARQVGAGRLAEVHLLRPPAEVGAASWHLTRRGVAVLAAAVAIAALGLVWLAGRSAPPAANAGTPGPAVVTVHAGDTLWAIASRVAPGADPRAEVALLQRINGLRGAALVPGQQLHVR